MGNGKLYDAIFKRKSIRKYDLTPLDSQTLADLEGYITSVKPMVSGIEIQTKIVSHSNIKNMLPIEAPHYLLFFSKGTGSYLTNAGFMLQQIDLYLSANGIGSCYLGMANPKKELKEEFECAGFEFVIMLGFGKAQGDVHRADISEFSRRKLPEISEGGCDQKLMEAARLSPSATNSQPWFFISGKACIHAYCSKANIIKAFLYEKMNKVDMGIALSHIAVAAEHEGMQISFADDENAKANAPKGNYYIATVILK